MRKKTVAILMAVLMAVSATGCGAKEAVSDRSVNASQAAKKAGDPAAKPSESSKRESSQGKPSNEKSSNEKNANEQPSKEESPASLTGGLEMTAEDWKAEAEADAAFMVDNAVGFAPEASISQKAPDDWGEGVVFNTEEYSTLEENSFRLASLSPLSTFSADVDTASYSNVRRMLRDGCNPEDIPSGAVRTEEMLNYFSYQYAAPKGEEPFGVTASISPCPWNAETELLVLGLQTAEIDFSEAPNSNLVFLIDVSGSMADENKLPLLKQAFQMLAENLGEKDRVSIVTYASRDQVALEGVSGKEYAKIASTLNELEAGGGTNGGQGIITAYELAEKYFIQGGNNRVILATDGDLNVGITSESQLHDLIEQKRQNGVFLSVLGFGTGNYSDTNMETLADYGNGNYSYIDSVSEAKKVLVEEMGATLVTVAKDVKLQVEFNPAVVAEYRLIGYENRKMAAEDFEDDTKDGGEIGAGHSVTVAYEILTREKAARKTDKELKYQDMVLNDAAEGGEWLTLSIRYKEPDGDASKLLEYPVGTENYTENPSEDFRFAAAVAEFSMVLRNSAFLKDGGYKHVLDSLDAISLRDEYREEFYHLVETAKVRSEW